MAKPLTFETVADGEWVPVHWHGMQDACCDCGLVHVINYRIFNGTIELQATRDKRATAAMRRSNKFRK